MTRHNLTVSLAMATLTALGLAASGAAREQVPFRGRFAGVATTVSVDFPIAIGLTSAMGHATHLGKFAFEHPHTVNVQDFTITGSFHFLTANGDEVFADFSGQSSATPTPGVRLVVGTAAITGGTGRFKGATGSVALQRLFNSVTNTTVGSFDGTISSPRSNKR